MARDFDGVDDKITGTITAVDTGDWTMGLWPNVDGAGESGLGAFVSVETAAAATVQALQFASGGARNVLARQFSSGTTANTRSTTILATATLYLLIATFRASDGKCRIFYGTQTVAMAEMSYDLQDVLTATRVTAGTVFVAENNSATTATTDGRESRLFFTARELGLPEMNDIRRGTQPTPDDTDLRVYWPLDDPNNVFDLSGNGVTGTASGTTHAADPIFPGTRPQYA